MEIVAIVLEMALTITDNVAISYAMVVINTTNMATINVVITEAAESVMENMAAIIVDITALGYNDTEHSVDIFRIEIIHLEVLVNVTTKTDENVVKIDGDATTYEES